jgi:hypothetical protein
MSGDIISKSQFARQPAIRSMSDADAAIVSKLVVPKNIDGRMNSRKKSMDVPDAAFLGEIANKTAINNNDAINLFQVLPDMELAKSILVSAILSPTDMVTTNVLYNLSPNKLDDNLTGPMLTVVRDYFDQVYKIKKFLPEMLSDALFMKGAYPLLVMAENSIDHSINSSGKVTFESVSSDMDKDGWFKPYGILGIPDSKGEYKTSLEDLWGTSVKPSGSLDKTLFNINNNAFKGTDGKVLESIKGNLYVTDNPAILSNPNLLETLRRQRQAEIYGTRNKRKSSVSASNEAAAPIVESTMTLNATERMFYANRQYIAEPMQTVLTSKQLDRGSVSNPLVMHLPTESVIPIHVPGDVRNHIGYFIILDVNGYPLRIDYTNDYYSDIRASIGNNPDMSSQLLTMTRQGQTGAKRGWGNGEIDHMQVSYQRAVENDLLNRLRSGAVTGEYELANCSEVYRLMFARSLAAKNTMLLYVPAELMTYITFDYNEFGVGKSLLEDGKILASLRAVLLFASTMSAVKNAADTKNINITIPEEDENPYETATFMLGEYAKINGSGFPIGETHPGRLVSHLQAAGTVITVQGNTAFPEAKFEVEQREGVHKAVDKELDDELRRRHIQTFGLTPETMEASAGADFATTVVNQHIMLLKRVIHYQEEFTPFLTDFIRRYTINSGPLLKALMEVVEANEQYLDEAYKGKSSDFVAEFIDMLLIELPAPETNRLADQMTGYDAYSDAVTKAIEAYINSAALDPIASQGLEGHLDSIKASMLSMYQRRYLREKNILPELDVFNTLTEDDGPAFNLLTETQQHLDGILNATESYMKRMLTEGKKRKKRTDKQQAEIDALANGASDDADDTAAEGDDGSVEEPMDDGSVMPAEEPMDDGIDGLDDGTSTDEPSGDDIGAIDDGIDTQPNSDGEYDPVIDEAVDASEPSESNELSPTGQQLPKSGETAVLPDDDDEEEIEQVAPESEEDVLAEPIPEEEEEVQLDIPGQALTEDNPLEESVDQTVPDELPEEGELDLGILDEEEEEEEEDLNKK